MKCLLAFLLAALVVSPLSVRAQSIVDTQLRPEAVAGFNRYVAATEARIDREISRPETFLYLNELPQETRERAMATLQRGGVYVQRLETRDSSGRVISTPGGLIHHWLGDVLIPGVTVDQALAVVEDYNRAKDYYPQVVRSRLLSRQGNDFKVALRLREHKVITVTLDTDHDVRYTELDPRQWSSRSVSTRIAEVVDAGKPDEHEKPPGHDAGFLWRINSYWRFVQQNGGVYVECESISLTRDIPTGLGWLVGPFVTSIPEQSLTQMLAATRKAVLAARKG